LTFNLLLDTLAKHDQTMTRFQANSSTLHRCLIKWDKLKAHDQSFTRTSIRLALELQSFMNQMDDYFRIPQDHPPHHHLQHQHHEQQVIVVEETTNITTTTTTTAAESFEEEPSTQITPSPISLNEAFVEIITAGPSAHRRIEEDPSTHQPNYTATVSTTRTTVPLPTTSIVQSINPINPRDPDNHHLPPPPPLPPTIPQDPQPSNSTATTNPSRSTYTTTKLGLRKQIVLKYRLNQLRFKSKKFNQKFQLHETKKFELKLNGNQCIINMVDDGKALLEINEAIVQLVFHLSLLRKPKPA
jgi:hypothetical protein